MERRRPALERLRRRKGVVLHGRVVRQGQGLEGRQPQHFLLGSSQLFVQSGSAELRTLARFQGRRVELCYPPRRRLGSRVVVVVLLPYLCDELVQSKLGAATRCVVGGGLAVIPGRSLDWQERGDWFPIGVAVLTTPLGVRRRRSFPVLRLSQKIRQESAAVARGLPVIVPLFFFVILFDIPPE